MVRSVVCHVPVRRLWLELRVAQREAREARAEAAFAREQTDLAIAGLGVREDGSVGLSVRALSVADLTATGATRRALSLWRRNGVVVFPSLLDKSTVSALCERVRSFQTADFHTALVDRTPNIRAPANRTLRAIPVVDAADALKVASPSVKKAVGESIPALLAPPHKSVPDEPCRPY